jgi:hypothetical protein
MKIFRNLLKLVNGYLLVYEHNNIENKVIISNNGHDHIDWKIDKNVKMEGSPVPIVEYFLGKNIKFGEEWNSIIEKHNKNNKILFTYEHNNIVLNVLVGDEIFQDSIHSPTNENLWKNIHHGPYAIDTIKLRYSNPLDKIQYIRVISSHESFYTYVTFEYPISKKKEVKTHIGRIKRTEKIKIIFGYIFCIDYCQ